MPSLRDYVECLFIIVPQGRHILASVVRPSKKKEKKALHLTHRPSNNARMQKPRLRALPKEGEFIPPIGHRQRQDDVGIMAGNWNGMEKFGHVEFATSQKLFHKQNVFIEQKKNSTNPFPRTMRGCKNPVSVPFRKRGNLFPLLGTASGRMMSA